MRSDKFLYVAKFGCFLSLISCIHGHPPLNNKERSDPQTTATVHTYFIRDNEFWKSSDPMSFFDSLATNPLRLYVIDYLPDSTWYDQQAIAGLLKDTASIERSGIYQLMWENAAPATLPEWTKGRIAKRLIRALRRRHL